jgi:diadenosine tetraphosphate (Ap4A) HIT family hydrolase
MAHAYRNTYDGYNLFSNNGSARIGQQAGRFHQHVFLRFTDEDESPYTVMARGGRWAADATDAWTAQRDLLRAMLRHATSR